eukprot:Phypoly_transcript_07807.p1 GENE.Phypoly_transcript_07807~~Phypoly_transcript_07807.p1  ORF type:complete len:388 (+),score=42.60 Phypoly_transcript_07807:333-1496(+)
MGSATWYDLHEFVNDRRVRIAFLTTLGFAFCVGIYEGILAKKAHGRGPGLVAGYAIVNLWEASIFGFGIAFFIVYGQAIKKLQPGMLRKRCVGIWIAISYFFVSWFPHASVHQFLTPSNPTDYIILEICFHWPNLVAGLVLCYYQFDVLWMSYDIAKNNKTLRGWSEKDTLPTPWYKKHVYPTVFLTLATATAWAMFAWKKNPVPPDVKTWQRVILIIIYVTDGLTSGFALGFAYCASRLAYRLPKKRTRTIAAISIAAITYTLIIATPHPVAHNIAAHNPNHVLIIEYLMHFSITAAVSVLAYFQLKFLNMAIDGRIAMGILKYKVTTTSKTSDMIGSANSGLSADLELRSSTSDGEVVSKGEVVEPTKSNEAVVVEVRNEVEPTE